MIGFFKSILTDPTFSVVAALIGFLAGHHLAIGRDKRKEFNELVTPIYHDLLTIRNQPHLSLSGTWEIDFLVIREKLPFWKRKCLNIAIENYKKSKSYDNQRQHEFGGFVYKDTKIIVNAVNDLLKYLKPK
jgi:hypothetical protein